MRHYETIFIARPDLSEDDLVALIDRNAGLIEEGGGSIIKVDRWGLKKLAYPIRKLPQGYYVLTEYTGTPEAVQEMERLFRIDDRVLKYMTVKLADKYEPVEPEAEAETEAEATAE